MEARMLNVKCKLDDFRFDAGSKNSVECTIQFGCSVC